MTAEPEKTVSLTVSPDLAGSRLDRLIADLIPGVARRRAVQLIQTGRVRVDGHRYTKSYCPSSGQVIEVRLGEGGGALAAPEVQLVVLFETPDLVVVDKPAGVASAALPDSARGTVAGALLARYPELAGVGYSERDPGLLHRLDTQTSGVLVAAKTQESFEALRVSLQSKTWDKRYLAIVLSASLPADQGHIDGALEPDTKNRRRVRVAAPSSTDAHPAQSDYKVLARGKTLALVEVRAQVAYRHQVRAHLASIGCPLIGDDLYGGEPRGLGGRHALHASFVAASFLLGGQPIQFSVAAELPADLLHLLESDGLGREAIQASVEASRSAS